MAVIKGKPITSSLKALTATALALPGLLTPTVHAAEGDEVDFQYSHYQEGKRDISVYSDPTSPVIGSKSFNPIEVDSLHGSARVSLTDRVKFAFNYLQDTWGGATPTSTVPFVVSGNSALYGKNAQSGTVVGASPYVLAGPPTLYLDSHFNPLSPTEATDPDTGLPIYKKTGDSSKLTHIMATASPETRKQGDFKLSYDWDNASANLGGGISIEDDYESRFGNIGGRLDFNQKRTTLIADLSYTNSVTNATLDHDNYTLTELIQKNQISANEGGVVVHGTRQDWATHLGLTQVLNKNALLSADFSYTRSTGYLNNPYKGVSTFFINPDPNVQADSPLGSVKADIYTFYEKRPEVRNQYNVGGRYVQYIEPLDAAFHFDYRFSADDWGIQSHTFEADWVQPLGGDWTVTPRIRYYSQDAANFYTPYLISEQGYQTNVYDAAGNPVFPGNDGKDYTLSFDPNTFLPIYIDAQGNPVPPSVTISPLQKSIKFDPKKLPANFSSDHRLSGYGALSGGVTITKQFAKGLTLETGFEYYTHQGSLKIGGGGEGRYADFDYWLANAALKVNLEALALGGDSHDHTSHDHHAHGVHAPAGVMFDHMLPNAGDFMVGYRYMWNSQSGNMLNGNNTPSDSAIASGGCGGDPCYLTADNMSMTMHMLDLMYAPTDWLTLMLMPQFMDMDMDMRALNGKSASDITDFNIAGHFTHHSQNGHETGGIGDLGMYALFKLFDNGMHHIHATAGLTAPTGDVNIQFHRNHQVDGGYMDYGMQLGSGTWDFKPSLTYTGHINDFSWGAQANGVVRMENHNRSGYRLGDLFQATAWGNYNLTNWLTASVRGVYTVQGRVQGQFNGSTGGQFTNPDIPNGYSSILKFGPQDYPQNYGGRFWDVGFGLSAMVPSGDLAGNRVSVEWLQPVHTDFNGYQLDRDGALSATWGITF